MFDKSGNRRGGLPGLRLNRAIGRLGQLVAVLLCSVFSSSCVHRTLLSDLPKLSGGLKSPPWSASRREPPRLSVPETTRVWFVRSVGDHMEVVAVKRPLGRKNRLELAVRSLLDGPTPDEVKKGLGSEIPRGTVLLGVEEKSGQLDLNLSHRFASGGVDSIETRLEQLTRTILSCGETQSVYLDVEGQRLNMTPGDGVEVKQPINK